MAGNRDAYEQAMNAGHNAAWDQEWMLAIQSYGRAIQEFPDDPEAHIHLGLALLEVGRLPDALKVYSRAHQLAPQDPIPLEKSADVLERLGRQREAAQQYINVAEIYFSQRDLDKTIANWERATRLTPGLVAVHGKLAQLKERIGDNAGAVRQYLILAYHFQRLGDNDKALKSAQRALRLEKSNSQVLNTIRALESGHAIGLPPDEHTPSGRQSESSLSGRSLGSDTVEDNVLGPLGEAMTTGLTMVAYDVMESGNLDAAASDALQAMEFQRQGLRAEAIKAYQKASSRLTYPALKLNLGGLLLQEGNHEDAARLLTEALREPKLEAGAYHGLGQAYFQLRQYGKAANSLIQAMRAVDSGQALSQEEIFEQTNVYEPLLKTLEGRDEELLLLICRRFLRLLQGKEWHIRVAETRRQIEETMRDQGIEGAFEILVASHGDELTEAISRIDRYYRQNLLTLAMDEAHHAIEVSPHYLPVHTRMAEIMMREGRLRQAINKYTVIAKTYLVRGEYDRSSAILTQVLQMAPLNINVRQSLIELLETEQRWNEAIDQYIELADTYNQLGSFEQSRDTFGVAERLARRVAAPGETIVRIKHRMADIDQMRLDMRRAQKGYEEILQLAPEDERAHRMLVDLNYRQGNHIEGIRRLDQLLGIWARSRQLNKITQLLEELVTLYGNDTGLRSRLAAIYRQIGRKPDAIVQLDALGELQLEAGLHREAANTIRQIIALEPEGVEEYRRLLAQLGG
jgi:tetratricopeptide (TPR) repeat protein